MQTDIGVEGDDVFGQGVVITSSDRGLRVAKSVTSVRRRISIMEYSPGYDSKRASLIFLFPGDDHQVVDMRMSFRY